MLRSLAGAGLLFAIVAGAIVADDRKPTIDEIMQKINNTKKGLHGKVGQALKAAMPTWDEMQKQMKDYCKFADALGKNDPPKGDKKNWEKLCKDYAEKAKKLQQAVDKKDKDAAQKAFTALQKSCKACHDAHRE